jgi:hypothetical protein
LLARRARDLELSAISALAPSYFKPQTIDQLIEWCAAIAGEAPDLPFYYYDIPAMTGVSLDVIDRLLDDPSDDPLMIMGKAIDLDWNIMLPVIAARAGTPELRESRAEEANKKYRKLSTYSAQRVMRFWQQREKAAAGK